jgi:hypothetical protein
MALIKAASLLLVALASSPAMAAQDQPAPKTVAQALQETAPGAEPKCDNDDPDAVVVCGRSQKPYRIDPNVLAATRAAEASPPKPPVGSAPPEQCTGPNCGGGSYVPLVGMALTALKAAELAAQGDDWRDAFRTRPDQYRLYQEERARQAKKGGVSIGVTVGNARP